jgi:hypothetical protein
MAMSDAFLAQLAKGITSPGAADLYGVLELSLPDGTTLRASNKATPGEV